MFTDVIASGGSVIMTENVLLLIIAAFLMIYLLFSLLRPEKF
jgi:K+-transporting ATPase KdpF subunit